MSGREIKIKESSLIILFSLIISLLIFFGNGLLNNETRLIENGDTNLINSSENEINPSLYDSSNYSINDSENKLANDDYSSVSEVHWSHMPIRYKFSDEDPCSSTRKSRVLYAFNELNNSTGGLVSFIESDNYDLFIVCSSSSNGEISYQEGYGRTIVLAEGGIDSVEGSIITKSTLHFYPLQYTGGYYPSTEVHEIMHGFGVGHTEKACMIMSPVMEDGCRQIKSIDEPLALCLKHIYSNGLNGSSCEGIMEDLEYSCSDGWYSVEGSDECCPEPNMEIIDGYCYSK